MPSGLLLGPIGLGLLAAAGTVSGRGQAAVDAEPLALLCLAVAGALAAGFALPRGLAAAYGLVAAGAVCAWVLSAPGGLSGAALAPPLGYGNANGALCAQGAAAAVVAVHAHRGRAVLLAGAALAVALVALAWQTASAAGLTTAAAVAAAGLALRLLPVRHRVPATRLVVVVAGAAAATALAVTTFVGVRYDRAATRSGPVDRLVDRALSERRAALWSDAVELLRTHPVSGVGVGRFAGASPTARSDSDAAWAHAGHLQVGAETGFPGLLALLLVVVWVFVSLYLAGSTAAAAAGSLAAAALLTHASVDYVLHFPVLPLLAAATVGVCLRAAVSAPPGSRSGRS